MAGSGTAVTRALGPKNAGFHVVLPTLVGSVKNSVPPGVMNESP
jgi:hypothetical protein